MGEESAKIRKNVIFVGLMLGMLVAAASQTIVSPAMPVIVADLGGRGAIPPEPSDSKTMKAILGPLGHRPGYGPGRQTER